MIAKLKKIYNDYKEKKKKEKEILELISPNENYISYVQHNGEILIRISVQNISDEEANKFGETMFCISNGLYTKDTAIVLKDLQNQDHERALFVEKALARWKQLVAHADEIYYNNLNAPVVSPRSFMKKDIHEQPQ